MEMMEPRLFTTAARGAVQLLSMAEQSAGLPRPC